MILQDGTTNEEYGIELILDLYNCDLAKISDGEHIKKFLIELCDHVIEMKRYGESFVEHFGHKNPITSGYSMVQLIETSNVSGHFSEHKKAAYVNIFSCRLFDDEKTAKFCQEWFGAKRVKKQVLERV